MVGNMTEPVSDTPAQGSAMQATLQPLLANQVANQVASQPASQPLNRGGQKPSHQPHLPPTSRSGQVQSCRYCSSLDQNTDRPASEIATIIKTLTKKDFHASHHQFEVRNSGKWTLPPQGCLQWLHASMDERVKSLGNKPQICKVCLAAPDR